MSAPRSAKTLVALPLVLLLGGVAGWLARGTEPSHASGPSAATAEVEQLRTERDRLAARLASAEGEIAALRAAAEPVVPDAPAMPHPTDDAAEGDAPRRPGGPTPEEMAAAKAELEGIEYHLKAAPTDPGLLRDLVARANVAGEIDRAIALLTELAAQNPDQPEILNQLGRALLYKSAKVRGAMEKGSLAFTALDRFDQALAADPEHFGARYNRAVVNYYMPTFMKRIDRSVSDFETLVKQNAGRNDDDRFALIYLGLGHAYRKAGRQEDARRAWAEGRRLFPGDERLAKTAD